MIVLDASVLVAHLSSLDAHHEGATRLLLDTAGEPLRVHALTMAEVLVGGVRTGKAEGMQADLHAAGVQMAPRDDGEPLRLARLRVTTGLKLPDCCVLDAAAVTGARVGTFDQALAAAARRLGLAVLP